METKINFTLKFGTKNLYVIFNPAEDARVHKIGLNGRSFESVDACNAIGELINVAHHNFKFTGDGLFLHAESLDAIRKGMPTDNAGYAVAWKFAEMVDSGVLGYRGVVDQNTLYRLRWDGLSMFGSAVDVPEYVQGEPEWARHNRNAYHLIKYLNTFKMAEDNKMNIQLFWLEKEQPRFDLMEKQWKMFLAGEFEALAESIRTSINGAVAYTTMKSFERKDKAAAEKAAAEGKPVETAKWAVNKVSLSDGTELMDPNDLLGSSIKLVSGTTVLPTVYKIDTDNLGSLLKTLKVKGYKVAFVTPEEAAPAKDAVTPLVINSKAGSTKVVKAKAAKK